MDIVKVSEFRQKSAGNGDVARLPAGTNTVFEQWNRLRDIAAGGVGDVYQDSADGTTKKMISLRQEL